MPGTRLMRICALDQPMTKLHALGVGEELGVVITLGLIYAGVPGERLAHLTLRGQGELA